MRILLTLLLLLYNSRRHVWHQNVKLDRYMSLPRSKNMSSFRLCVGERGRGLHRIGKLKRIVGQVQFLIPLTERWRSISPTCACVRNEGFRPESADVDGDADGDNRMAGFGRERERVERKERHIFVAFSFLEAMPYFA